MSEVILDNKILCPSMSSGTIFMQTVTATAGFPILTGLVLDPVRMESIVALRGEIRVKVGI